MPRSLLHCFVPLFPKILCLELSEFILDQVFLDSSTKSGLQIEFGPLQVLDPRRQMLMGFFSCSFGTTETQVGLGEVV